MANLDGGWSGAWWTNESDMFKIIGPTPYELEMFSIIGFRIGFRNMFSIIGFRIGLGMS